MASRYDNLGDLEDVDADMVLSTYYATFGDEADFDRWTFPGTVNLRLMQEALTRGSPVTEADLDRVHQALFGEPYPGETPPGILT
jgi:hypothetical protein